MKVTLYDVIGHEYAKKVLLDGAVTYFNHKEIYEKVGARAPGGVVLYGPPGTGKSMLIRALVNSIENVELIKFEPEMFTKGNHLGNSAENIAKTFTDIRNTDKNFIVAMDEMDTLCPVKHYNTPANVKERTEAFKKYLSGLYDPIPNMFVIGTTNDLGLIEPSILRDGRFDYKIEVDLPTQPECHIMCLKYLPMDYIEGTPEEAAKKASLHTYYNHWSGAKFDALRTKLVTLYISGGCRKLDIDQIVEFIQNNS